MSYGLAAYILGYVSLACSAAYRHDGICFCPSEQSVLCLVTPITARVVAQEHDCCLLLPCLLPSLSLRALALTQYTLAAHCVSQLHAVGGRTTYGLPYNSLMLHLRKGDTAALSCHGMLLAAYWWQHTCKAGGTPPLRTLAPRGMFRLCLRTAEIAAGCWRRRNGLPAAADAAAAAGPTGGAGASGDWCRANGGGRKGRRVGRALLGMDSAFCAKAQELDRDEGGAGECGSSSSGSCGTVEAGSAAGAYRPGAMLDVDTCPELALTTLDCSRSIMAHNSPSSAAARRGECSAGSAEARGGIPTGRAVGGGGSTKGRKQADRGSCSGGGPSAGGSTGRNSRATGRGGNKGEAAWLGDGGPLARRWWRAAVAAVHCRLDNLHSSAAEGDRSSRALAASMGVLGLYPYLPAPDQGGLASSRMP